MTRIVQSAVGEFQPRVGVMPLPIVSKRNPTGRDIAPLGQIWVNKATNTVYFLSSVVNKVATWATQADTAGALNVGGALTCGGILTVNAGGAAITGATAVTGAITATTTITAATGLIATAGGVTATAGGLTVTAGDATITAGDVDVTAGNLNMGAGQINLAGPVQILTGAGAPANGLAVNVGDIYIRTDAAAINTRVYIATAPGGWTTLVTSA